MCDGPHRSLNMRKGWKELARMADTPAFAVDDIVPQLVAALSEDWREEVGAPLLGQLRKVLIHDDQNLLFGDQTVEDMRRLRNEAAGQPLALTLIECAERVAVQGAAGEQALEQAARKALDMRITRGLRQVEEHYLRKTDADRAGDLRGRGERAAQNCQTEALARSLVGSKSDPSLKDPGKQDGIDDGVPL